MAFSSKLSSLTVTRRSISFFINFARQFRPRGVYSFGSMVSVPSTVPSLMFYFCVLQLVLNEKISYLFIRHDFSTLISVHNCASAVWDGRSVLLSRHTFSLNGTKIVSTLLLVGKWNYETFRHFDYFSWEWWSVFSGRHLFSICFSFLY